MKAVLRGLERLILWGGLILAVLAKIAIGLIVGRPAEKSGNQANFTGGEQQKKRLAIYLDGTWN